MKIEYMPEEYKGKLLQTNKFRKTTSRKWTQEEVQWLNYLLMKGYTSKQIAESMDRSVTSVEHKRKKETENNRQYNKDHILEKQEINALFIEKIKPRSVLDLYCGYGTSYIGCDVTSNDINPKYDADYHMDAYRLLCKLYSEQKHYDFIDIDPYGTGYDCFDLGIKMARKGLAITFGEMGSKRFRRLEQVWMNYDIKTMEEFNIDNILRKVMRLGYKNKKELIIYDKKDWQRISRVWFIIKPFRWSKEQLDNTQKAIKDIEKRIDEQIEEFSKDK